MTRRLRVLFGFGDISRQARIILWLLVADFALEILKVVARHAS